jgi:hypothetical protein
MKLSAKILAYLLLSLPVFTIITSMNTVSNATTTNAALSEDVDSRITSLQSEISNLTDKTNRWNGRYIRSLTAALFIGLWTLVCQFSAIQNSRLVSDRQSELLHVKDIKAATDSQEKDRQITQVRVDGDLKIAGVKSGADQKIAAARDRSEEIAAESRRKAAELENQNLATAARLVAAQQDLEKEKLTRLELEKTLAPRILVLEISGTGKTNFDSLKPFAGTVVILEALNDAEAQRAATEIAKVLRLAGWTIESASLNPALNTGYDDGVHIETEIPPAKGPSFWEVPSYKASKALEVFLKESGWIAVFQNFDTQQQISEGKIRIRVGFKPSVYFVEQKLHPKK